MNFWDSEIWVAIVQFGIIFSILLFSNALRRKVSFIRKSLLPTAVVGGIVMLILKFIPFVQDFIDKSFLEMITYHTLGLGFIALALKVRKKSEGSSMVIIDTGAITVSTYVLQGIVGLLITLFLSLSLMPDLFASAGLLLPLGFGQGPGQALNFGKIYQGMGFVGGTDFGLAIAGVGFLVACLGGVLILNIWRAQGKIKINTESGPRALVSPMEVDAPEEIPLTESIDKFTIQMAFVVFSYFLTYLILVGLTELTTFLGDFGENTIKPLLWGFNFLFGVLVATIVGTVLRKLKSSTIMTRQYPNNFMLNRIGGFMFDIMVIASIGAIEIKNIGHVIIPFLLICLIGGFVSFLYVNAICKHVYPSYRYQAFFSMFGMLTGTASTGMILLREVDPNFETPAATNLVLQNFPAIVFGFPLMLLLTFSPLGTLQSFITLGILALMFVGFNVLLLRRKIFKKMKGQEGV